MKPSRIAFIGYSSILIRFIPSMINPEFVFFLKNLSNSLIPIRSEPLKFNRSIASNLVIPLNLTILISWDKNLLTSTAKNNAPAMFKWKTPLTISPAPILSNRYALLSMSFSLVNESSSFNKSKNNPYASSSTSSIDEFKMSFLSKLSLSFCPLSIYFTRLFLISSIKSWLVSKKEYLLSGWIFKMNLSLSASLLSTFWI